MRKYTESMPSATDYRHLKLKIGLLFSLPILALVWFYSIWGLIQTYSPGHQSARVIPTAGISATVVGGSRADDGDYLDVEFLTGARKNRVNVAVRRQDIQKYPKGQSVTLVRDDTPGARYDYSLAEDYARKRRAEEISAQVRLWMGALVPLAIACWFWKRWKRPPSKISDIYGAPVRDISK